MVSNSFKHCDSCWCNRFQEIKWNKNLNHTATLLPCPSTAQTLWQCHLVWTLISQALPEQNNQWKSIICTLKSSKSNLDLMATNLVSTSKTLLPTQSQNELQFFPTWSGVGRAGRRCHCWGLLSTSCEGSREDVADEEGQFLTALSTETQPRPNSDGKTQQRLALSLSWDGQISYFRLKADLETDN